MELAWPGMRWLALLQRNRFPLGQGGQDEHPTSAAEGDYAAQFETFFLRYDRQITSYLWRMTGDEQLASELAQETFLRAWQHFAEISNYEQPLGWLFRVATNLALQQRRRRAAPVGAAAPLNAENDPASSDPTVHFVEQDLVRQTLLQLPLQQRAALILREVYGLSCAEVGNLLNCSRDAVKMALFRAREQFRAHYLREDEDGQ